MTFPYPEDPQEWQTAYMRDDAFKEYGKHVKFSEMALLAGVLGISTFIAVFVSSKINLTAFNSYARLGILLVLIVVVFLLFQIVQAGAFRIAIMFLVEFYQPPEGIDLTKIINYRLHGKFKLPPPFSMLSQFQYIMARDGEIVKSDKWPAWSARNLGGPILLIVFDGCALYLERGNRFSRIVGPGDKVPFLEWHETVKYVVDLRPKVRDGEFDVWTKDGINLRLKIQIKSQIGDPKKNDPTANLVYPYDPIAIKKAIERHSVRWPNRLEGSPSEFTWADAAWGQVTGIVPGYIGSRTLDDLLLAERQRGQILSPNATQEIFDKLNLAANGFGVYLTDFQLLSYEVLSLKHILMESLGNEMQAGHSLQAIASITENLALVPDELRAEYKGLLQGLEKISAHARAALESDTLFNKQEQLRQALAVIKSTLQDLALMERRGFALQWNDALEAWESLVNDELEYANSRKTIQDVFVAGNPLLTGNKVFKGRGDLFRALESELTSAAEQVPTLLLFGARRTGKTSVIKQMPIRLGPQVIPVEIDLQRATNAENVSGLLTYMGESIQKSCTLRDVDISRLPHLEQDPYITFQSWLDEIESAIGERRILMALDEFETLGTMLVDKRIDERIFRFLRGLIQQHPKIILLFSGAHTLEDMDPIWSHYLVNVKMLKVSFLKESEARELITKPIPDFILQYDNDAVERILSATACQPLLLQFTCRELVDDLNEAARLNATCDDVEHALSSVLESAGAYFNDLFNGPDSNDDQRTILTVLAKSEPLSHAKLMQETNLSETILTKALRCLIHRDVLKQIDNTYQYQVELVRRWVQGKA